MNRRAFLLLVSGSAVFAVGKMVLVYLAHRYTSLPPWLSYALILTGYTLIGWSYHGSVTFPGTLSLQSLWRYTAQSLATKGLDFVLFTAFVTALPPVLAVVASSAIVFLIRIFLYVRFVFKSP